MIQNISIATDDGIINIGDYVNIYPVYLSRAIIIWGNYLNWLQKTIVSDHIFVNFFGLFGNSPMANECSSQHAGKGECVGFIYIFFED